MAMLPSILGTSLVAQTVKNMEKERLHIYLQAVKRIPFNSYFQKKSNYVGMVSLTNLIVLIISQYYMFHNHINTSLHVL